MTQHRILSIKNQYYIPKEEFLTVLHYCRQYPLWVAELKADPDSSRAITYDKDRVQTSNVFDPTEAIGMRRAEIAAKKRGLEEVAREVGGALYDWIILGVCYGMTYYQLQERGIPCGKDMYYDRRRKFYYEIARRL